MKVFPVYIRSIYIYFDLERAILFFEGGSHQKSDIILFWGDRPGARQTRLSVLDG